MTAAGTIIGRFELLRLLAAGGMGEVYLARVKSTIDGFGALAAVKLLPRNLSANQAFVKMFLNEARAVGKLHHKNIVQVRDIAEHDGQYYMVMEYIAGQNLRELLGDASIPDRPLFEPRLGAEIFADVASALGAAHAEGLVHRDVSPNNIMIGDEGSAKLIDFGVARALGSASLTNPGTLKGKFGYMAPEYVRAESYDDRVDVFSIGVVMWETFARRRLFRGTSAAEQLHQLLHTDIPSLETVVPGFPADLAALVAGALERDPSQRVASASALADALTEIARALPVGQDLTLRKWLERRIPGRLDDRRRMDQTLLSLPAGGEIPDFGVAFPDAGSTPGTYGFDGPDEARRSAIATRVEGEGQTIARGEHSNAAPPAPARSRKRLFTILGVVAVLVAAGALVLGGRDEEASTSARVAAGSGSAEPAKVAGSDELALAEAHRQIGLEALSTGDYAKASSEFQEAIKAGGGGDLQQLLDMAGQLARDDAAKRAAQAMPAAPPAPDTPATGSAEEKPTRVAVATPGRETRTPPRPAPSRRDAKAAPARDPVRAKTPAREPATETPAAPHAPPPPTNIAVFSAVPHATVFVDGAVVGTTPLYLPVSAGAHKIMVKAGEQVLQSSTITAVVGETTRLSVDTPLAPPPPPPAPPKPVAVARPPAPAPLPPATPRVTSDGDARAGSRVVGGTCNTCHAKKGVGAVSPRAYSRAQWERFFASGQHDRYQRLGEQLDAAQMMAARAYLRANAADTAESQAAGVQD